MRFGYARVSADHQNLDLQIDALKKAGCDEIFEDHGVSGDLVSRPALDALVERLRPDDTLVIWSLDRLARNLTFLLELVKSLDDKDVHFVSLRENMETETPEGLLAMHILGAIAQYEKAKIGARCKAGLAAAKARGVKLGRPRKISDTQLQEAKKRLESGHSTVQNEAQRLGVVRSTLYRRLGLFCL